MGEDTYHTHPKDLLFNKEGMTKLWNLGNDIKKSAVTKSCVISREDAKQLIKNEKDKCEEHPE